MARINFERLRRLAAQPRGPALTRARFSLGREREKLLGAQGEFRVSQASLRARRRSDVVSPRMRYLTIVSRYARPGKHGTIAVGLLKSARRRTPHADRRTRGDLLSVVFEDGLEV